MVPKRIMVATDGSPASRAAEAFAASLANSLRQCEVRLVTVVRPGEVHRAGEVKSRPLPPGEHDTARILLAEAEERVRQAITCTEAVVTTHVIEESSPAKGLVEESHADGTCSLIVVGNRGMGGFGRLVMGSVSTQVIQEAHCPVVVVKT